MSRLAFFFQRLETGHPFVRTADLEAALDADGLAALRAAGILRPASPLETVPCDDPKKLCFRRVNDAPEGDAPAQVGTCKDPRGTCAPRPVRAEEIAQEEIADPKPVLLGTERAPRGTPDPARKVVLVARPSFGLSLALLADARKLVLVPTARGLAAAQRAKHAPGSYVTLEVLEEALTVDGGLLARADGGAKAPKTKERVRAPVTTATERPLFPGAKHWRDVRFCLIDGTTVRIDVAGKSYRRTYVNLGMANARNRNPTKEWRLLVAACEGRGSFQWRPFGQHPAAAKVVSRLRARLKALFGITEPPFATFSYHHGWRARFVALPELPVDLNRPLYRR